MSKIDQAANTAIFQMQLSSRDAERFIQRETGCTPAEASLAVKSVTTGYKK